MQEKKNVKKNLSEKFKQEFPVILEKKVSLKEVLLSHTILLIFFAYAFLSFNINK